MSAQVNDPVPATVPAPQDIQPEKGFIKDKDARNWFLTRLGHEGMMLDKIQRQNKIVEDTVKGLQEQGGYNTSKTGNSSENNIAGEEDMGVSIGNETRTENHYHYAAPQQPEIPQTQKSNGVSDWKLPAAILTAGALTGAGMYLSKSDGSVHNINPPAQQIIMPENRGPVVDTDLGVGFGQPESIDLVPLQKKENLNNEE